MSGSQNLDRPLTFRWLPGQVSGKCESFESASVLGMFVPDVVQNHVLSGNKLTTCGHVD